MITGKNAELYFGESVYKQMNIEVVGTGIVIDNSMREQDTFTLTETLCDSTELKFGACIPNQISFTGREIPASIKGKKLHPVETLEGNEDDPFEYGTYTVYSDVPTADRTKRQITAYDAMYDIINADVKSWYAGLSFPMTLKAFRDSFFSCIGIVQKETVLVNDGMTINKTLNTESSSDSNVTEVESISGKTVIEAICEINGVFGNINRDGKFEYVELEPIIKPLYPSNDLYPREDLFPRDPNTISMTGHYITFDYEDFQSKAITQLEIRPSDDSAGVIVGTSGNNYVISGNFLVSDKTGAELEAIAENTLSVIKKVAYIPIKSSNIVGNPCIELGDPIRFNTTREIIESYVLQRTLTGIQSKRDSITSLGTETHSAKVNSIKDTISNLSGRTNKLERTADHTLSEISAVDSKVDELDESVQESVNELSNKIYQTAEGTKEEITKTLTTTYSTKAEAQGYASAAESNANAATDTKLGSYSTTTEMKAEIEKTASGITHTVSKTYSTKTEAQGYASTAESNANAATDEKLEDYATSAEVSTQISQTAHSVSISASGSGNTAGITIALYDENGNLIDTEKTANITITGFVSFEDLVNAGRTTINGANITTGSISCDRLSGGTIKGQNLEGCKAVFSDGADAIRIKYFDKDDWRYYMGLRAGFMWIHNVSNPEAMNGIICDNEFCVGVNDNTDTSLDPRTYIYFHKDNVNGDTIEFYCNGNRRPLWRKYVNGQWLGYEIAIKSDIPDMSDYLKKNASGKFNADYASSAGAVSTGGLDGYNGRITFSDGPTSNITGQLYYKSYNGKYYLTTTGSSKKIKHDVLPVRNPELDPRKLYDLRVVQFKFNDLPIDDKLYEKDVIGFIAEEVADVYPLGAEYNENGEPASWWDRYLIPPMLYLIQEQHKEIEQLKQDNLALQNRLSILEQKMEVLENVINNQNN